MNKSKGWGGGETGGGCGICDEIWKPSQSGNDGRSKLGAVRRDAACEKKGGWKCVKTPHRTPGGRSTKKRTKFQKKMNVPLLHIPKQKSITFEVKGEVWFGS